MNRRTILITPEMAGCELVVFDAQEIVENGIVQIEIQVCSMTRKYTPAGKAAKWFRDELGQLWVKFDVAPRTEETVEQKVIPASRIVEVTYIKYPT